MTGRRGVTWAQVKKLGLALPEVREVRSYGTPGLHVAGKFMARLREDGETMAVKISFEDRDFLIRAKPTAFFITDHYLNYPSVVVRLAKIGTAELRDLLETVWRRAAPKRLVTEFDRERMPR